MSEHPRYWLSRLILCSWGLLLALATLFNPDSLTGRAILQDGALGAWVLLVLALSTLAGMLDILGNDVGRLRCMRILFNQRHVGYSLIACLMVLLAGVVALHTRRTSLVLFFLIPGFFAALVTWLDLFARHDARRKAATCA